MYVDGVQRGSTYTRNHNFTNRLKRIGDTNVTQKLTSGSLMDSSQIIGLQKDKHYMMETFYPPTSALTATSQGATSSNVKLLCCQSNSSATAATIIPTGSIGTSGSPTATNFNAFTTDANTVRGQSSVYCVLDRNTVNAGTLDEAALVYAGPGGWRRCYGDMGFSTGKWYYEVTMLGTVGIKVLVMTTMVLDGEKNPLQMTPLVPILCLMPYFIRKLVGIKTLAVLNQIVAR